MLKHLLLAPEPPAKAAGGAPAAVSDPAPASAPAADAAGSPENAFAEVDAAFAKAGLEATPKEPASAPKPASGETKAPAAAAPASLKPAENAQARTPEKAPAEVQRTPKELRAELDRTKSELATHQTTTTALEKKIADYESRGKDTEALRARLEARDKEFEKLQGELRALKQEASPEFKAKYDEPINSAIEAAQVAAKRLEKPDGTPVDFWKEIVPIHRMMKTSWNKATAMAVELLGGDDAARDGARMIMTHLERIDGLEQAKAVAFEKEKEGWAAKAKEEEGLAVQRREQFNDAWKRVNQDLEASVEAYKVPVDDQELVDLKKKGLEIFDADTKTTRELLWKNAHIRHRAAAFGPNQLTIKRQAARISALETELKGFKPNQPNPDPKRAAGTEAAPQEKSWEVEFRERMASV